LLHEYYLTYHTRVTIGERAYMPTHSQCSVTIQILSTSQKGHCTMDNGTRSSHFIAMLAYYIQRTPTTWDHCYNTVSVIQAYGVTVMVQRTVSICDHGPATSASIQPPQTPLPASTHEHTACEVLSCTWLSMYKIRGTTCAPAGTDAHMDTHAYTCAERPQLATPFHASCCGSGCGLHTCLSWRGARLT
jgi:hypothetical protein